MGDEKVFQNIVCFHGLLGNTIYLREVSLFWKFETIKSEMAMYIFKKHNVLSKVTANKCPMRIDVAKLSLLKVWLYNFNIIKNGNF